jgi:hypothetical protein
MHRESTVVFVFTRTKLRATTTYLCGYEIVVLCSDLCVLLFLTVFASENLPSDMSLVSKYPLKGQSCGATRL